MLCDDPYNGCIGDYCLASWWRVKLHLRSLELLLTIFQCQDLSFYGFFRGALTIGSCYLGNLLFLNNLLVNY